jgi:hypothetical protein
MDPAPALYTIRINGHTSATVLSAAFERRCGVGQRHARGLAAKRRPPYPARVHQLIPGSGRDPEDLPSWMDVDSSILAGPAAGRAPSLGLKFHPLGMMFCGPLQGHHERQAGNCEPEAAA